MRRLPLQFLLLVVSSLMGCSGRLVALSTNDGGPGSIGSTGGWDPATADCAVLALDKSCSSADGTCHGGSPPIVGLDLSGPGIVAAHNGADLVGRPASDDVDVSGAACSPMSMPPAFGKYIIDPQNPQASLLYAKMQPSFPCGARMPLLPRPRQPMVVSAVDQACILAWIKHLSGVAPDPVPIDPGMSSNDAGVSSNDAGVSSNDAGSSSIDATLMQPIETDPLLMNCGVVALNKSCASADGVCHGGTPPIVGLDLTLTGIAAAHHGADFVGRAPSSDVEISGAACSPLSLPPVFGKYIVDPQNPEASLLYAKMQNPPPCGARAPLLPRPKQPMVVSAVDQACILDWIKSLPGVSP